MQKKDINDDIPKMLKNFHGIGLRYDSMKPCKDTGHLGDIVPDKLVKIESVLLQLRFDLLL